MIIFSVNESRSLPLKLPVRSRLYHLTPVGLGTPYVESLTGYAARLAEKHSTTLYYLFSREIASLINKPGTISLRVSFASFAKAVNGLGVIAADLVDVFERLTLRRDLRFMTMLPWAGSISSKSLTREARAWCPDCYEENIGTEREVYDQLLWSIKGVTVCSKHGRRLEHECPHCGRRQTSLSHRLRPGFCSRCQGWLGRRVFGERQNAAHQLVETTGKEMRIAEEVGRLLAVAPELSVSRSALSFTESLRVYVGKIFLGKGVPAKIELPASKTTLRCWLGGTQRPNLSLLLETCFALNLSPADLVLNRKGHEASSETGMAERAGGQADRQSTGDNIIKDSPTVDWKNEESVTKVEKRLRDSLLKSPPVSLTKIAKELKCTRATLRKKFPALASQLAERAYAYYRPAVDDKLMLKALQAALEEIPPPPLQEVSRRLGEGASATTLRKRFPAESRRVIRNYSSYRKRRLDDEALEKQLLGALNVVPPPSMREFSGRVGVAGPTLYRKFPRLAKALFNRSAAYRREENARRREMAGAEIRSICEQLLREGCEPSFAAVRSRMSTPCQSGAFSKIRREVLAELPVIT